MAIELFDAQLTNVGFVVLGGFIGSSLLTLFPYFMEKNNIERTQADIRKKPPEQRTPEENYMLESKPLGFFAEYRYRFFFGLLSGIGSVLAFLQTGLGDISALTASAAVFAGMTASGFFSALADKIRATTN